MLSYPQVAKLEGELSIQTQEVDHLKTECGTLWKQLDSLNSQLFTAESQLDGEKKDSRTLQVQFHFSKQ